MSQRLCNRTESTENTVIPDYGNGPPDDVPANELIRTETEPTRKEAGEECLERRVGGVTVARPGRHSNRNCAAPS